MYDPDAGKRVLKAGIHIADLASVFHEGLLHPCILAYGEEEHAQHEHHKRQCELPVDQEQEYEGTGDLHYGDEEVLGTVVREFCNVKKVGYELAHHLAGIVAGCSRRKKAFRNDRRAAGAYLSPCWRPSYAPGS